jgi:hypothetical protein
VKQNLNVINPDKDSTLYEDFNQPQLEQMEFFLKKI